MSDEVERTLCQLPLVHVFKIPARKSAEGHRAADWPKDPSWTGKLKIVAKGKLAGIFLVDDKNQIFAVCQVTDDSAVERTLDSGRYFVLRITNNQGRHAFIGIAFNERNDAFDFNVALSEFKGEVEREEKAAKFGESLSNEPHHDYSIKSGEKIKIKLNPKKAKEEPEQPTHFSFEAPKSIPAPSKPSAQTSDPFGDPFGSSFGSTPAPTSGFSSDPFANFDSFSSSSNNVSASDPFATFDASKFF